MKPLVGSALTPFRVDSVSPGVMRDWAQFLHDPNPIHLDEAVVRAKGLGERVINQGPCNLAYIISMLQAALPGGALDWLDIRYVNNVYAGDAVEAGGTVIAVTPQAEATVCVCEIWLRADARGPVITGTASVRIPG